jgi:hypothetical protein
MMQTLSISRHALILAVGGLLVAGCASFGKWPESETQAYKTFEARCGSCHGLPHPGRNTPEQWDRTLGLMVQIMDERKVSYTKNEMSTIRQYLHRNAR